MKDKANHAVVLDKATSDKLYKDVQSYRLITVATLVDRLKINGSLARKALNDLEEKGQIKKVVGHSKLSIYSEWYSFFWLVGGGWAREGGWGLDGCGWGWGFCGWVIWANLCCSESRDGCGVDGVGGEECMRCGNGKAGFGHTLMALCMQQ